MKNDAIEEEEALHEVQPGLNANTLNTFEMLAQSVAGIAPTAVMATGPALVALGAGDTVLYSYMASTVVMALIGFCIARFARHEGENGTLLSYVTSALGRAFGFIGAAGLAFGYVLIAVACLAGTVIYLTPLLGFLNVDPENTLYQVVVVLVVMTLAALTMIRGVHLSTRFAMALEILSVGAILVVLVAVFATSGFSAAPFKPADLGIDGIAGGMVLAILGYVGFESAANLGTEAKDPAHSVPRAVVGSVVIVGVLYLISAYAQLVGFGSGEAISSSAAPLNDLADNAGVSWLGYLVAFGAVASFFACVTGSLNAASRLTFQMAADGYLPRSFGHAHKIRMTPHRSIVLLSVIATVIGVGLMIATETVVDVFGVAGTIGTFGYLLSYLFVAFGVGIYLKRRNVPYVVTGVIGLIAGIALLFVIYKNIELAEGALYESLPIVFLGLVGVSIVWYFVARGRGAGTTTVASPQPRETEREYT